MLIRHRSILEGLAAGLLLAVPLAPEGVRADEPTAVVITIRDHRFTPADVRVPAGVPLVLEIRNEDASAEEFESTALKIERIIPGRATGKVRVRPLEKGTYRFVGEFHEDTATGVLVAE